MLTQELDEHTPVYFDDNKFEGGMPEEELKDSADMMSMVVSPRESQSELVNGMNAWFATLKDARLMRLGVFVRAFKHDHAERISFRQYGIQSSREVDESRFSNAALPVPTDQRKYKETTLNRVKETYTFAPRILPATSVLLQRKKEREAASSTQRSPGKSPITRKIPMPDDKQFKTSTSLSDLRSKSTKKQRAAHQYTTNKQAATALSSQVSALALNLDLLKKDDDLKGLFSPKLNTKLNPELRKYLSKRSKNGFLSPTAASQRKDAR